MTVHKDTILKALTVENLAEKISGVIQDDQERVEEDIKSFLFPRLDFICDPANHIFFLFEECYIETEWRI